MPASAMPMPRPSPSPSPTPSSSNHHSAHASSHGKRRRRWLDKAVPHVALLTLVLFGLYSSSSHVSLMTKDAVGVSSTSHQKQPQRPHHRILNRDQCNALRQHEEGKWQHHYFTNDGDSFVSDDVRQRYTPLELSWLEGKNDSFLPYIVSGKPGCKLHEEAPGLMYTSRLGHQCGCGVQGFQPSHSVWTHGTTNRTTHSVLSQKESDLPNIPSLRLIERLAKANHTLCFMGDSIDLQFYDALRHNIERIVLQRQSHPSPNHLNISIESREIPVTYANETTGPSWYGEGGFRYMNDISETTINIEYDGDAFSTSYYWIKSYGWSPGHTSFMDHCTIIIANLGLHYNVNTGRLANSYKNANLTTDFHAAITYLANSASEKKGKISIWRSALPQHFDTRDGHHKEGSKSCSLAPRKAKDGGGAIQKYNQFYADAFAEICNLHPKRTSACIEYEHICTVDRRSMDYPTLYRYYKDSNCCRKRLSRLQQGDASVTGTVLRWDIADLFDEASWHIGGSDCSHYCYIPALYEAAFERLGLLLPFS